MKKIFVGIDFSKEKVDVSIISAEGLNEISGRVFNQFKNSSSGYRQLLQWVGQNSCGIDKSMWLFCGENTGGYSIGLCDHLYSRGYDMWLENAKSIKDTSGLRRLKSDRADASMIAEYAMRNYDRAALYEPLDASLSALRELFLYRRQLVTDRCRFEVRRGEKKLTMQKSRAKNIISQSGRHIITELKNEIARVEKEIKAIVTSSEELSETFGIATSVPGIGPMNAVCLMVYTNNFHKFGYNARKIACYYGVAPFGKDSGTSVHTDPHVHYMANRQIKAMLTQAAWAAVRFNPKIARYYERLVAAGKKKPVAINNVRNKLLHWVTAMVKHRQYYDPLYLISA